MTHPLIDRLHELCDQIARIEGALGIQTSAGREEAQPGHYAADLRPRIEPFHDILRSLIDPHPAMGQKYGALSLEQLAHAMQRLREIAGDPFPRHGRNQAPTPQRDVVALGLSVSSSPWEWRRKLTELYEEYAVLFGAALTDAADQNYRLRNEELQVMREEWDEVHRKLMQDYEENYLHMDRLEDLLDALNMTGLKADWQALQERKAHARAQETDDILERLDIIQQAERAIRDTDEEIRDLEQMHRVFLSGQMMMFQEKKQLIAYLAQQGISLGEFTERSLGSGLGTGRGRS